MKKILWLIIIWMMSSAVFAYDLKIDTSVNVSITNAETNNVSIKVRGTNYNYDCNTNQSYNNFYSFYQPISDSDYLTLNVEDIDNLSRICGDLATKQNTIISHFEKILDFDYMYLNYTERYNMCITSKAILEEKLVGTNEIKDKGLICESEKLSLKNSFDNCNTRIGTMLTVDECDDKVSEEKEGGWLKLVIGLVIGFFGAEEIRKRKEGKKNFKETDNVGNMFKEE